MVAHPVSRGTNSPASEWAVAFFKGGQLVCVRAGYVGCGITGPQVGQQSVHEAWGAGRGAAEWRTGPSV